MSAPLSVLIPTLNAAAELPRTADALLPGLTAGLIGELVVSDGGSTDETPAVAEALGAVWVTGARGRGGQLARAAAAAKGPWLLLLHADSHLSPHWVETVERLIAAGPGTAGYFWLSFRADGAAPRLVAGWANLRSRWFGLPYGDQGLVIHRDLLAEVGGIPEIPLMEDVALVRRLRGRLSPLTASSATSAERYLSEGWLKRGRRNLWTLVRYLSGTDPEKLAIAYRR